jgi:pimeloyl-ACP methyl ester carboxylesterase
LIERLAEDLRTVIAQTGNAPVTLVGHSIGGMMMLTLARLHPVLSPLIRQSNFMSYMNGTSHIVNLLTSLSGNVTREQLDFASRYNVKDTPSVIAKGLRAVLRWDETATPGAIHVLVRAITGDVDKLTKPEAGIEISRLAPNADFVRLAPVGHNGLIEQGPRYAEAIRQFMRRTTLVVS